MRDAIVMAMPKRAADFFALGVKCWKAALQELEPYAKAQPPGNARRILLNEILVLRHMIEHADRRIVTAIEEPETASASDLNSVTEAEATLLEPKRPPTPEAKRHAATEAKRPAPPEAKRPATAEEQPRTRPRGLDRRARTRPPNPSCPVCDAPPAELRATIRTAHLVYFKCNRCGEVVTVDLPKRKS